jgi:hypothetical protein
MEVDKDSFDRQATKEKYTMILAAAAPLILPGFLRIFDIPHELEVDLRLYLSVSFLLAVLLGKKRKLGFTTTYIISLLLTPIAGCVAALLSQREN